MLDYEAQGQRSYQPTAEDYAWLRRRLAYYAAQLLLLFLLVLRIGPNLFLFHSPFSPSPADYVSLTNPCIPIVAAIKAYQRDTGSLPSGSDDLPEIYLPANYQGPEGEILGTGTITFVAGKGNVLEYDFRPATEGWNIYAPRFYGRIPAALVQAAPAPTTVPTAVTPTRKKRHASK